jgi:hypothetical protein
LEFPEATKRIGKPTFEKSFMLELHDQKDQIPLEDFCSEGFPDDNSVEVDYEGVTATPTGCVVRVSCSFNEICTTGCSEIRFPQSGNLVLNITLRKGSAGAVVEVDREASISPGSRDYEC